MKNAKILIIGGSSDLALAAIKRMDSTHEKITFYCHYNRSAAKLDALSKTIRNKLIKLPADLEDSKQLFELTKDIELPTHILFFAAPKMRYIRFKELNWEDIDRELNIQLRSSFEILKELLPKMAKGRTGHIIFILSNVTTEQPPSALSHYTLTKYAQLGMLKTLASEFDAKKLHFHGISPSMIETSFLTEIPEKLIEISKEKSPKGNLLTSEKFAEKLCDILDNPNNYPNGSNIPLKVGE